MKEYHSPISVKWFGNASYNWKYSVVSQMQSPIVYLSEVRSYCIECDNEMSSMIRVGHSIRGADLLLKMAG